MRHSPNGQSQRSDQQVRRTNNLATRALSTKPNAKPKIADIFAGVGGFSLGAVRAGFDVAIAIDLDRQAIAAHKKNFPRTKHARRDIAKLTGAELMRLAGLRHEKFSGIIGGPPCQGFSRIGRRRKNDSRNQLFYHFFRLVSETQPTFFVAENVPGILDAKYEGLRRDALKLVSPAYTVLGPIKLCASDFGAATLRPRVFFIGITKRCVRRLLTTDFARGKFRAKTSVRVALTGLAPRVGSTWQDEKSSWKRVSRGRTKFLTKLNSLCGDAAGDPRAIARFKKSGEISGFLGTRHQSSVIERFSTVAAGKTDKVSKFPRLRWDGLCPTLRAGTDHRRGSYQAVRPIHPAEDRVITPREAARLQGFPDWFQFSPTKWHSFRQIGNSLSPFVSHHLLRILKGCLT